MRPHTKRPMIPPDHLDGRGAVPEHGGIVAASTAASFSAPPVAWASVGADRPLSATSLLITGTVAIYAAAL